MIDFSEIDYLKIGTDQQQQLYQLLVRNQIITHLKEFSPFVIGTFPLDIAVETSDVDIACCFDEVETFQTLIRLHFNKHKDFRDAILVVREVETYTANFLVADWPIEIFAQKIPVKHQDGYRHMIIEHQILEDKGATFKSQIRALKREGVKTEPAFAALLGILGDPYKELLSYQLKQY